MNERAQRQAGSGRFITLEGPDGAGKSIHAERLAAALRARGLTVTLVREPGGTALGEAIRRILLDRGLVHAPAADALLFNAARAQLVAEVVRPALGRGEVVVCDRFADSTLAYQGHGSGMDLEALRVLAAVSTGGLVPDRTILLDLPVEVGLERRRRGPAAEQTRFEDDARHDRAFHDRVRAGFLALAEAAPGRWRVVDAAAAEERVAADVLVAVADLLPTVGAEVGGG